MRMITITVEQDVDGKQISASECVSDIALDAYTFGGMELLWKVYGAVNRKLDEATEGDGNV